MSSPAIPVRKLLLPTEDAWNVDCTVSATKDEGDKERTLEFDAAAAKFGAARQYSLDKQEVYREMGKIKVDAIGWFEGRFGTPEPGREGVVEEASRRGGEKEGVALTGSMIDSRYATAGQRSTSRHEHRRPDVPLSHRPRLPPSHQTLFPPAAEASQRPALHRPNGPLPHSTLGPARIAESRLAQFLSRRDRGAYRGSCEGSAGLSGIGFGGRYGRDVGHDGQFRVSRPASDNRVDEQNRLDRLGRMLERERRELEDHQATLRSHTSYPPHHRASRRYGGT
jgi:hypothetical protein